MDLSLPATAAAAEDRDVLGGAVLLSSGVYKGTIMQMYLHSNANGTKYVNLEFKTEGNKTVDQLIYISNKKGEFTYKDKKTGDLHPLPGYSSINSLCVLVNGKGLAEQPLEDKVVSIYNYTSKSDVPTSVKVFSDLVGQVATIGILSVSEEKTTKESGYKEGTGEFREYNDFSKFFSPTTNKTLTETAENKEAEFIGNWSTKNKDKVKTIKAKIPGKVAAGAASAASPKSIFGE